LCRREADKSRKKQGQVSAFGESKNAHAADQAADHNAWGQALDQIPAHGFFLMVGTHTGDAGEDDGGHGCGDRHLDGQVGADPTRTQQVSQERHHDHAAANAQQARQKARAQAQNGQFGQQQRFDDHGGSGEEKNKVSASATGPAS